ncbi:retroelement pol polyprotein-like [Senna tora]|uniref:Retroelement pol polyprotein-like n=1 Tax=Senna tora TaxID=362788 RepID=A0A834SYK8_9FABA|nr:retroelement pol polyprotein-like [Senna tora]
MAEERESANATLPQRKMISPYDITSLDNPGLSITQVQFKGNNYAEWARDVKTDELSDYDTIPTCECGKCSCDLTTTLAKKREDERVHTFLLGLGENLYSTVRSSILAQESLPSVHKVYSILVQEERVKNITRTKEDRVEVMALAAQVHSDARDKSIVCSHCKKTGHVIENCFALVGYPEWWGDRARGDGRAARGRG